MANPTIFHNPRCSKSREALSLLKDRGLHPTVRLYLESPPTETELRDIVRKLALPAKCLLRTKEDAFKQMTINQDSTEEVIRAICDHPILLERPVVVTADRAVIARPPENLLHIL